MRGIVTGGMIATFVFHDFGTHMGWLYLHNTAPFRWYLGKPDECRLILRQMFVRSEPTSVFGDIKPGCSVQVRSVLCGNPSDVRHGEMVIEMKDIYIGRKWMYPLGALHPDENVVVYRWLELISTDFFLLE